MAQLPNLGSIAVKGRISLSYEDFKESLHLHLIDNHNIDSNEADILIESKARAVKQQFRYMTNVIEFSELGFNMALRTFSKKILK